MNNKPNFIVSKYTHPKDEESYMYYYEVEDPEADNAEKRKERYLLIVGEFQALRLLFFKRRFI